MPVLDLLGAVATAITLLFLVVNGYLLARKALGAGAADPLALAIATLLAAIFEAELIAIVLGKLGLLRIEAALMVMVMVFVLLVRIEQRRGADSGAEARLLWRRVWARTVEHPAMSLIAVHALAAEALRGLLRPPLSWDSVMYHLPIAGTWLQEQRIAPIFGMRPISFYGLQPAGGPVWLWWWLAPSHGELYVNLAAFPHAVLLALAAGGVARELGARRHWPLAGFLALMAPVVLRAAATQYADLLVGGTIVAGCFFALRWIRSTRAGDALLLGAACGVAAGAKVLGLGYAAALAGVAVLLARGEWRRRAWQLLAAAAVAVVPASIFYFQAWRAGVGPFAAACEGLNVVGAGVRFPRPFTLVAIWPELIRNGNLLTAFLGSSKPKSLELGLGPPALLLLAALLLPLLLPRGERRSATLVWSQIAAQAFIFVTVPYANGQQFLANPRYLDGAFALAFAGLVAAAERRGVRDAWLGVLAFALLVQDLVLLHEEMPFGVRIALAIVDLGAVSLALSPRLRELTRRHAVSLAVATSAAVLLVGAPLLGRWRVADRGRAFGEESTFHETTMRAFAGAWEWLDAHGGNGTVAVVESPTSVFWYPAMGPHLERRVVYVNSNRDNVRDVTAYPGCDPRQELDPQAWLANLRRARVRWVHVGRFPGYPFPPELDWAAARPDLFALRYRDPGNAVLELLR
ncbi:MAG TPA: hypothetical protein VGS57_15715 [Thermoanaerobaculia bacterium]|jgi:hypothetical protein|nr:hypothetical protein [Thermoanaerobaculia bacterium]